MKKRKKEKPHVKGNKRTKTKKNKKETEKEQTYLASRYDEAKVVDEALLNLNKNKPKAKHVTG